jgi:hypothetical protein
MGLKGRRRAARPPLRPSTEEILADLRDPLPPGRLEWGLPTRCPRCHEWGYLDRLDLVERLMQLHCPTCRFHWEITEAQIEAASTSARGRDNPDS